MVFLVFWDSIPKRCKGVHCVDLGESFPTSIYLQNLASIQPRTSLVEFARSPRTDPPGAAIVTDSTSEGAANTVCPRLPVDLMLAQILKKGSSLIPSRKELLPVVLAKHGAQIKALEGWKRSEFDKFCDNNRECFEAIGGKYEGQTVQAVSF